MPVPPVLGDLEEVPQRDAEGVDVRLHSQATSFDLFVAHLERPSADDLASAVADPADGAQVDQLDPVGPFPVRARSDDHVLRLHVAVQQPAPVQVVERREDLQAADDHVLDAQGFVQWGATFGGLALDVAQHEPVDVFHDDVLALFSGVQIVVFDKIEDADDVRVIHHRERSAFGGGQRRVTRIDKSFEDNKVAVQVPVSRQIYPTEAAASEATHHLVLVRDQLTLVQAGPERIAVSTSWAEASVPTKRRAALRAPPVSFRDLR